MPLILIESIVLSGAVQGMRRCGLSHVKNYFWVFGVVVVVDVVVDLLMPPL